MKRLFLFAAITLSVQVSAQFLSKEEAKRYEEQRVAKAMLALQEYAVNDTIKISIKDIEELASLWCRVEVDRELNDMEDYYLKNWAEMEQNRLAEIAQSLLRAPRKIGEKSGASFVIDVLSKLHERDITEGWDNEHLEDSLLNFLMDEANDTLHFRYNLSVAQWPVDFQGKMHRYEPRIGDIIVYDLGDGKLHFAIAISEGEIIHDTGDGVVIDKKEDYDKYEKVCAFKRYWYHDNSYMLTRSCASKVKIVYYEGENKTIDALNAMLEVVY